MSDASPHLQVLVPATSANLGPGFDCLALALSLHNTIEVLPAASQRQRIEVFGEGSQSVSTGEDNLILRAMRHLAEAAGRRLPPLHMRLCNAIPLGRGLGSSAAAIVGGLFVAACLLELPTDPETLLPLALQMEEHPDNIAAALYGGLTIGVLAGEGVLVRRIELPATLSAVLLIPDCFASTLEARAVLPKQVSRADAIFNTSRVALLVADLAHGRLDALAIGMDDRLHQPYRAQGFPYLNEAIAAARAAGAHGAALSGAGSSVIALTSGQTAPVAMAMASVAARHGVPAHTRILAPEPRGVHIAP